VKRFWYNTKISLPCGILHDHKEEGMEELDWTSEGSGQDPSELGITLSITT
jgi:hypothetical protein